MRRIELDGTDDVEAGLLKAKAHAAYAAEEVDRDWA